MRPEQEEGKQRKEIAPEKTVSGNSSTDEEKDKQTIDAGNTCVETKIKISFIAQYENQYGQKQSSQQIKRLLSAALPAGWRMNQEGRGEQCR